MRSEDRKKEKIKTIQHQLKNFDKPDEQLDALSYFTPFLGTTHEFQKEIGKEVIDLIVQVLKESKKAKVRLNAAKVLGALAIKPELVLPVLDRAMWLDRSYDVKESIPLALVYFEEEALSHLKKAVEKGEGGIRLNAIKALGAYRKNHGEIISFLKKKLKIFVQHEEKFWFSMSLIRLEGISSDGNSIIENLIKNDKIPNDLIEKYKFEIKWIKESKEIAEAKIKDKHRIKEKYYQRKKFIKFFFHDLVTFNSDESGFDFQDCYATFIKSIITTFLINSITMESLSKFPSSKNLPDEIVNIIESDLEDIKKKKTINIETSENDLNYYHVNEILLSTRMIQYLSLYNLDYIKNKFIDKEIYDFQDIDIKDIFSGYAIEEIIEQGKPIKPKKIMEDQFWKTKGKELLEFWREVFQFDIFLNQQGLVFIIASLESFLNNCIYYLDEHELAFYLKNKNKKYIPVKDFYKTHFTRKIRFLIQMGFLDETWKTGKIEFETIIEAYQIRNKILHQMESKIDKDFVNELSKENLEKAIDSIAKLTNELYTKIALKIKSIQ
ncbi:MAG: HEAT repeat domain-containing protein [Candidatus Heimdallarchaeota archaeon]